MGWWQGNEGSLTPDQWLESSGTGAHATRVVPGTIVVTNTTTNGRSLVHFKGDSAARICLTSSMPSNYTLFSLARYSADPDTSTPVRMRILSSCALTSGTFNFVSGHFGTSTQAGEFVSATDSCLRLGAACTCGLL